MVEKDEGPKERKSNYASDLGDPCERFLVLARTRWNERKPRDPMLAWYSHRGLTLERLHRRLMEDAGYIIYNPPALSDPVLDKLNIGWRLDALIQAPAHGGPGFPIEVKAIYPDYWEGVNCVGDMLRHKSRFVRRYPAQLQVYMIRRGVERGMFYLVNGLDWRPKSFWVDLDYDYAESLLRRAEATNAHVEAGTLPAVTTEIDLCPRCDFFHLCLPDIQADADRFANDPDLVVLLEAYFRAKPGASAYEKAKKALGAKFKVLGEGRTVVGSRFVATTTRRHREAYSVDPCDYLDTRYAELKPESPAEG